MYEVTFLPILAAGVLSVVLASIWFHPKVFGGSLMAKGEASRKAAGGECWKWLSVLYGLPAAMLAAYVMNYWGMAWLVWDWIGAVELGFWCWLGFVAPTMFGMVVLWERKPVRYYWVVSGYWLVSFIAMALTLLYGAAIRS